MSNIDLAHAYCKDMLNRVKDCWVSDNLGTISSAERNKILSVYRQYFKTVEYDDATGVCKCWKNDPVAFDENATFGHLHDINNTAPAIKPSTLNAIGSNSANTTQVLGSVLPPEGREISRQQRRARKRRDDKLTKKGKIAPFYVRGTITKNGDDMSVAFPLEGLTQPQVNWCRNIAQTINDVKIPELKKDTTNFDRMNNDNSLVYTYYHNEEDFAGAILGPLKDNMTSDQGWAETEPMFHGMLYNSI